MRPEKEIRVRMDFIIEDIKDFAKDKDTDRLKQAVVALDILKWVLEEK